MKSLLTLKQKCALLLLLLCVSLGGARDLTAEAKKKSEKIDPVAQAAAEAATREKAAEAEIKKGLDPISTQLSKLLIRVQGRGLLSPAEAGQLVTLKYQLLDLMEAFPQNGLLAKPVYQAGTLFSDREAYNDAFEMFHYLAQGYASNPYGAKARGQIQILERQFGANYFSVEKATPTTQPETVMAATGSAPAADEKQAPAVAPATPK